MRDEDHRYHQLRAQRCREMAERASDPEVRRRHELLAALHAGKVDGSITRLMPVHH